MQGWTIQKILFYVGLVLFLPGLAALGYTLYEGPAAWATDGNTFWGTPIALFVFWIGLAHAGTLISAIFLALGVRMDRRTAVIAELSTLCSLVIAALFPLMHLGVMENFYMVPPLPMPAETLPTCVRPWSGISAASLFTAPCRWSSSLPI